MAAKKNKEKEKYSIYYSKEDKAYIAESPIFKGLKAHGKTIKETLKNIKEVERFVKKLEK